MHKKNYMIYFCTLFDSNYSAKGFAMYESLVKHCPSFHLYIFAFDDKLVELLSKLDLQHVTVVTLQEFEDEELLAVKPTRTAGEYCWTCSGSTILYCLTHYQLESCTYIDADLYFFSDPAVLIQEMGDDDVLITEHRYSPVYDQTDTSGKYCVQFMTFKNNENGLFVLRWWRNACLEWCYCRFEDGKFGDQKYLDDWTRRFHGIHELQHLGGGVAPWNVQQYTFEVDGGRLVGIEIRTGKKFNVAFFHFHALKCEKWAIVREFFLTSYQLPKDAKKLLYDPYIRHLKECFKKIKSNKDDIDGLATKPAVFNSLWQLAKRIVRNRIKLRDYRYQYWLDF